jgi:hypothetical protein
MVVVVVVVVVPHATHARVGVLSCLQVSVDKRRLERARLVAGRAGEREQGAGRGLSSEIASALLQVHCSSWQRDGRDGRD